MQLAWLVELVAGRYDKTQWLTFNEKTPTFTENVQDAIRFSRKEDAEKLIPFLATVRGFRLEKFKATEHHFI